MLMNDNNFRIFAVFDLNSWIRHYDVASYDHSLLANQHRREQRAAPRNEIKLQLTGLDR